MNIFKRAYLSFQARVVRPYMTKHYEKTKYGRKLKKLKDIHKGERCFIIGNGPSLRAEDLDLLAQNGETTFAMNRIYKIFKSTDWRPTYYVCEDINIFNESLAEINRVKANKKFIPIDCKWHYDIKVNGAYYFYANYHRTLDFKNSFSNNIAKQMDSVGTVTFTCMTIAAYMGFSEIFLLGIDHNYHVTINEDGETVVDENAKDYFCNDYDKDIKDIVVHDMGNNTAVYRKAKAYADEHGIKIVNATRGGKLEVFPRTDFDDLF